MLSIRTIQSLDVQFLADSFPEQDENDFNALYIDHLQEKCYALVITEIGEDDERIYLGYACIYWQSPHTPLWRRNIPEITEIVADDALLPQLLHRLETAVIQRGLKQIGIGVEMGDTKKVYSDFGFKEPKFDMNGDYLLKTFV